MSGKAGFQFEDPLTYLPHRPVQEFGKDRVLYSPQQPSRHLYVTILGRVKLTSTAEDGCQIVARIVPTEGLFGESCLVGSRPGAETATALDNVSVMAWSAEEIEAHIAREPRLGIALSQVLVRQCLELQERIESMAAFKTPERVMLALVQLAETLGVPLPDGYTRIAALTHQAIADYVGTSREIVTFQMNRLRRMAMLRYSRRHIDVHTPSVSDALRSQGVAARRSEGLKVSYAS
jgi:CRP/FNR family transcriptional regulator, cyclic AMP receptor protein